MPIHHKARIVDSNTCCIIRWIILRISSRRLCSLFILLSGIRPSETILIQTGIVLTQFGQKAKKILCSEIVLFSLVPVPVLGFDTLRARLEQQDKARQHYLAEVQVRLFEIGTFSTRLW